MAEFDVEQEVKIVTGLVNQAGDDWIHAPWKYSADAAKLSQEVSNLASQGLLECTLVTVDHDDQHWYGHSAIPIIQEIDRDSEKRITGILFHAHGTTVEPVYATVSRDLNK